MEAPGHIERHHERGEDDMQATSAQTKRTGDQHLKTSPEAKRRHKPKEIQKEKGETPWMEKEDIGPTGYQDICRKMEKGLEHRTNSNERMKKQSPGPKQPGLEKGIT